MVKARALKSGSPPSAPIKGAISFLPHDDLGPADGHRPRHAQILVVADRAVPLVLAGPVEVGREGRGPLARDLVGFDLARGSLDFKGVDDVTRVLDAELDYAGLVDTDVLRLDLHLGFPDVDDRGRGSLCGTRVLAHASRERGRNCKRAEAGQGSAAGHASPPALGLDN